MRRMFALTVVAFAPAIFSQTTPAGLIGDTELEAALKRSLQLMESTSAAVPGLVRAAAPVHENTRQALLSILAAPTGHPGLLYDFLTHVRSYLALSDSFPKPSPFPEEARKQFTELRESLDRLQTHFRARLTELAVAVRSPDPSQLSRYAEVNAKQPKPAPTEKRIIFFGDSITDGWRLNEYFPGRDFVNRGIGGQVTSQMLGRMRADVIDLQPAAMLILAGTNDIARGTPLSTIENNLVMIADLADTYKIKPMFASVLPVSDHHKELNPRYEMTKLRPLAAILELNRWIESFCKQRNYPYVDYYPHLVDATGQLKAELADDGLHPNAAGYRVMAPIALDAIDRHIVKPAVPVSKKRAPRPPVEAKPEPAQAAAPRKEPAAAKPPAPTPATPVAAAPAPAPKPTTAATAPAATTPPAEAPATATSTAASTTPAAAPKKKREPFWKRTYPTQPPPLPSPAPAPK